MLPAYPPWGWQTHSPQYYWDQYYQAWVQHAPYGPFQAVYQPDHGPNFPHQAQGHEQRGPSAPSHPQQAKRPASCCQRLFDACQKAFPKLPAPLAKVLALYVAMCLPDPGPGRDCKDQLLRYHTVFRGQLHQAHADKAAQELERSNSEARGLVLSGLQQFTASYLQGESLPAPGFGGNPIIASEANGNQQEKAETVSSPAIETAVQQVLHNPGLAAPAVPQGGDESSSVLPKPCLAQCCPFPQEARAFVEGSGMLQLHKAALKDLSALQKGHAGISITSDAEFGVKRLVQLKQQNGYSWPHTGPDKSSNHSDATDAKTNFYRQLSVSCTIKSAILVDVQARPHRSCTFSIQDDAGLCHACTSRKLKASSGQLRSAVGFSKGELYPVTVILDTADSLKRGADERGVLQQMVLFTFLLPSPSSSDRPSHTALGPCMAEVPDARGLRAVVIGRRVSVALTHQASTIQRLSNLDAKPYIPTSLKTLFDTLPATLIADAPPFEPLFGSRDMQGEMVWWTRHGSAPSIPPPAHKQMGVAHTRSSSLATLAAAPSSAAGQAETGREGMLQQLRVAKRLLILEEAAMEDHIRRHDLYNARLEFAVFTHRRRYTLLTQLEAGKQLGVKREEHMYRGPDLDALLPHQAGKQHRLAALNVPGLLEGRPVLLLGDLVYLRLARRPDTEYAGYVTVTVGGYCLLAMPDGFWRDCSASPNPKPGSPAKNPKTGSRPSSARPGSASSNASSKASTKQQPKQQPSAEAGAEATAAATGSDRQLVHVRFSFDRAHLRRMHAALQAAAASTSGFSFLPDATAAAAKQLPQEHELPGAGKRDCRPSMNKVRIVADGICEVAEQKLNAEQRMAVASVLCGAGGRAPFALFGPPGTGKTVTLVECALQVLKAGAGHKLLLCAPGNYSADLLADALYRAGITKQHLIRLNDPRRPPPQAHQGVLELSPLDETLRAFSLPDISVLAKARVIVATCSAAGMLREGAYAPNAGLCTLNFSHVMIDEAGQAMLPEALIPITLLQPQGRVLLCGDPKQLGPVVRSAAALAGSAHSAGLAVSLHERFITHHSAEKQSLLDSGLAPATVQLVRNYRSHASLLHLPNRLFYENSLVAAADQAGVLPPTWAVHQLEADEEAAEAAEDDWMDTPTDGTMEAEEEAGYRSQGDDVTTLDGQDGNASEEEYESSDNVSASTLFYGVRGQQMQVGEGGSYCNPVEAAALVGLVVGLLQPYMRQRAQPQTLKNPVTPAHVGIIATYRNQVQKLRVLLRERGLAEVRCGTVDDFQGQEAHIIFISTVLSRAESLPPAVAQLAEAQNPNSGPDPHLGFWRNPKRFNVATTRARSLLVVVGHPIVLIEDGNWRELLRHCAARGAYKGAGASTLESYFGPSYAQHDDGNADNAQAEGTEADIADTMERMAEMSLLGIGAANQMYPSSMDDLYSSLDGADAAWRIGL